jgi:hypothetical protein
MPADDIAAPKDPVLVYLDHSVLNQLLKGRHKLKELLRRDELQVVYSDENLNEISKSLGCEQDFLSLLSGLNATYLRPILDEQFHFTDRSSIEAVEPTAAYAAYIANRNETPSCDGGMRDLLKKFYGGHPNKTFGEIVQSGQEEVVGLLDTLARELSSKAVPPEIDASAFLQALPQVKQELTSMSDVLGQQLDAEESHANVKAIDTELVVGPRELNNIKGPDVLKQIWNRISNKLPGEAMTFDEFFGLVRPRWVADDRSLTKLEQINAIYHQLNFLGYHRDEKMNRRFDASFSDLTHAGMASFCHLFLSGDQRLVRKAEATYGYLGIGTVVRHVPSEKRSGPQPSNGTQAPD